MSFHSQSRHKIDVTTLLFRSNMPIGSRVDIGPGALGAASRFLVQAGAGKRVLVAAQRSVAALWGRRLKESLLTAHFQAEFFELPDGESGKSPEHLLSVWEKLQQLSFERNDTVLALGGGAVCDLAGFAASTYLRGIRLALVPTTLLCQVDASIGGKTGINLKEGKNLAGTFYMPEAVFVDPELLSTLPEREFCSGLAEIIKYALIEATVCKESEYKPGPRPLLQVLEENLKAGIKWDDPALHGIVAACIKMKLAVVGKDPTEKRLRRCLNLGHTLAHALEKVSAYQLSHGEAVAIGLVFAMNLSISLKRFSPQDRDRVVNLLSGCGLPTSCPRNLDREAVLKAVCHDKKRQGDNLHFVLPDAAIGQVDIDCSLGLEQLAGVL